MADDVVYVESGAFKVAKIFDNKLKGKVPPMFKAATEKAIRDQKAFTADKKAADGKEFVVGGTINEIKLEGSGPKAVLSMVMTPLVTGTGGKINQLSMKANGKVGGVNPKRIEKDIEFLVDDMWRKNFMKKAAGVLPKL